MFEIVSEAPTHLSHLPTHPMPVHSEQAQFMKNYTQKSKECLVLE